MAKATKKPATETPAAITHLPAADLVQLNQTFSEAALAKECFAHAQTRHQCLEATREAARLRRELSKLAQEACEAEATKASASQLQAALDDKNATAKRWDDLVADLRQRYAIKPGQVIDPISGELFAKES